MNDGRVWHVRSYPSDCSIFHADTYEECDQWRRANDPVSYICPVFPDAVPSDGDVA